MALGVQPGLEAAARLPARSAKGLGARRTPAPGFALYCFVPGLPRPRLCPWAPPLAESLGLEGHSCLPPEGQRPVGYVIVNSSLPPPPHEPACVHQPRPKATSREYGASAKKVAFADFEGVEKVGGWEE